MSEFISLGEIITEPDGSNLVPVAVYKAIDVQTTSDPEGNKVYEVVIERPVEQEERYYPEFGLYSDVPYLRTVVVPEQDVITTDNSPDAKYRLFSGVVVERAPRGPSRLDLMGSFDELLEASNGDDQEEVAVARAAALGALHRCVIDEFRPITNSSGQAQVDPRPLLVGKTQ
ncbi:MAG TPA: hypothetical protein PKB09_02070 [Candidatus Saccharibacteria bacterium]|nr:hypothetical protein [Candidatus Saccharibacteria bacterium]